MAIEAVVFSQDPLINCCSGSSNSNFGMNFNEFSNYYYSSMLLEESLKLPLNVGFSDVNSNVCFNNNITTSEFGLENDVPRWDQQYVHPMYSSPEDPLYLPREAPPPTDTATPLLVGVARRKRRRRSCKNKEEVEQQRMTHIAVERNRRKQMNEYLAAIRSMMPPSYVQRGDQASIVGGAINYVKELEQLLQSMEAQKRSNKQPRHKDHPQHPTPSHEGGSDKLKNEGSLESDPCTEPTPPWPQLFADFFSFPQYSTQTKANPPVSGSAGSTNTGVGDIEVTMAESHANVKIFSKKQPKQLVKLVAGFQELRLYVLHLNVTTVDTFVLYSVSLKVEEGCQLNSVDDIAAAVNHILGQIQEEAADQSL